jgi:membrane fusion protein, multidrug efflux system
VSVGVATLTDVNDTVNAIGTLTAMNTAQVRAKVDGELKSILFTEGKTVKAGEVIAELDSRSFQVALSQAQGQLERDQALLRNAQLDHSRYQALWAEDAISKQQLDTQAALVQQLAGTVRTDQALVDSAKLNLEYTRVVAPISGRLGLKQVELGSLVRAGDPNGLVTITQTQPMAVVFSIPEKNVGLVQEKLSKSQVLPVVAKDRDLQSVLAKGQVLTTDNAIDVSTSTLKLKALLDNSKGQLFPNQFANIELQLQILKNTLAVPTNAVQRGSIGTYVLGVNPDKTVRMIRVSLGPIQGDWTAVQALKGDLAPGTQVVTDGADRLRDGSKVELVKQDPSMQGMRADSRPSAGATAAPTDGKFDSKSNAASSMSPTAPTKDGAGKEGGGKWSSANGASASAQSSGAAPSSQAASGAPASGDAPSGERPRWMDRVPPEMIDKIRAMSPEERRAFFQKMRERRQNAGGDQ